MSDRFYAPMLKEWCDNNDVLFNNEQVCSYSEIVLAACQTLDGTLPSGVSYTFNGEDAPFGFDPSWVDRDMWDAATKGGLLLKKGPEGWVRVLDLDSISILFEDKTPVLISAGGDDETDHEEIEKAIQKHLGWKVVIDIWSWSEAEEPQKYVAAFESVKKL